MEEDTALSAMLVAAEGLEVMEAPVMDIVIRWETPPSPPPEKSEVRRGELKEVVRTGASPKPFWC